MVCSKPLTTDRKTHMQITRTLLIGTFVALTATLVGCSNDRPAPAAVVATKPAAPVALKPLAAPDGTVVSSEAKLQCNKPTTPIELSAQMRRNVSVGTTGASVTTTHGTNMALTSSTAVFNFNDVGLLDVKGAFVTIERPAVSFGLLAEYPASNGDFQVAWPAQVRVVTVNAADFSSASVKVIGLTICV